MPVPLSLRPVTTLRGVGPKVAARLAVLGVHSTQDLLFHLPSRYQDRTRIRAIGELAPGDEAMICATVELAQVKFGRRRSLVAILSDGTGRILMRLFHFSDLQRRALIRGQRIMCFGEGRRGPQGLEMVHPEYRLLSAEEDLAADARLTPIYPATEGINQTLLRRLVNDVLELLGEDGMVVDHLPHAILERLQLPSLHEALRDLHRPPAGVDVPALTAEEHPARGRLAFEELLAQHLSLRVLRRQSDQHTAPSLPASTRLAPALLESLPFELTGAQRRVAGELSDDLARNRPMHRLVQGDVGSGKTVVAALAALQAIEAGHQVALMAPTELLAEQHLHSFRAWLAPLELQTGWLSGKLGLRERRDTLARAASGDLNLVVGTHALFQDQVQFARLGLVIVDEQHRFGVHQRLSLRAKGVSDDQHPHQLIMTATPIPRTLAMTAYADLDTSVIDELPPGRSPIETAVLSHSRRPEVVQRVHQGCREGQQAYWVCTLIEESEALEAQAAADTAAQLADALPDLRVGLVHGRMKSADKEAVMDQFRNGEIQLLVATTVIEVGVDVPNASLMIIENPERLGLSQLHQLRGRVGRGARQSACLMLYQSPLSVGARARLNVLRQTTDGFIVAERDLELRGPGEFLGTRQTGLMQLRIADLVRDKSMLPEIRRTASELLDHHPERVTALIERWLGGDVAYGQV